MTPERYSLLSGPVSDSLTAAEMRQGYHFCPDWDFMLIRLGEPGGEPCYCKAWTGEQIAEGGV